MIAPQRGTEKKQNTTLNGICTNDPVSPSTKIRDHAEINHTGPRLLLGWKKGDHSSAFGFAPTHGNASKNSDAVAYQGDGHAMTVAPTGAGKGVGALIPNLLTYPGSIIVVDPKGENYQVTARQRREMGQQVVVLDPFHQVSEKSDKLNPMDLFRLPSSYLDCDAEMLASQMAAGHLFSHDPYWNDMATPLAAAIIAQIYTTREPEDRNLNKVREVFYNDDMDYTLAVWLDQNEIKCRMSREEFISYLSIPSDRTRPCVRSTATAYVKSLGSETVAETLESTSFELKDLMDGKPITIYIVIPPEKLESHRALLRLWVGTLLTAVIRRKHIPQLRTLFMIDEAAQLGTFPLLRQAITLYRGYGLQVWSFWQDLSQLKHLYPKDWETMLNNSAAVQIFGVYNNLIARQWADVFGIESNQMLNMPPEDAMIQVHGEGVKHCRRASYLCDKAFEGLFDANERFLRPDEAVVIRER